MSVNGKKWKVVAGVTTAGILGVSGLALAGPGTDPENPGSIDLRDRNDLGSSTSITSASSSTDFTYPSFMFSHSADTQLNSPFDNTATTTVNTVPTPSPTPDTPTQTVPTPTTPDTPTQTPPTPTVTTDTPD